MINKLIENIYDFLKERLSSPFLVSLLFSWIIFNWKICIILFGSNPLMYSEQRIKFIELNYVNPTYNIWTPILSAVLYTLIYPFLSIGISLLWSKVDFEKKRRLNEIYKYRLLTLEESLELRDRIEKINSEISVILKSKDDEIRTLRLQIEQYSRPLDTSDRDEEENRKRLFEEYMEVDRIISKLKKTFPNKVELAKEIIKRISNSLILQGEKVDQEIVSFFVTNDLIERVSETQRIYSFTSKGKRVAAKILENGYGGD